MGWPQITLIVLSMISLGMNVLTFGLLWAGGFFS